MPWPKLPNLHKHNEMNYKRDRYDVVAMIIRNTGHREYASKGQNGTVCVKVYWSPSSKGVKEFT